MVNASRLSTKEQLICCHCCFGSLTSNVPATELFEASGKHKQTFPDCHRKQSWIEVALENAYSLVLGVDAGV
jgi:hypothetical protein